MNHNNRMNTLEKPSGINGDKIYMLTSSLIALILASCAVSEQNSDESHAKIQSTTLLIPFQSLDSVLAGKSPNVGESFYPKMQSSLEEANQESQGHVDDNNIVIEE